LIEMIADLALPFILVQQPSFLRFVESLCPGVSGQIPGRHTIARRLSDMAVEARKESLGLIERVKESGQRIGVCVDGWNGINKVHVDGITLKIARFVLPHKCEKAGSDHNGCRTAQSWEMMLSGLHLGWSYFCSDDAGQCGKARRILALRHPHCLFVPCWAHQINLIVKHILEVPVFCDVAKQANGVAKAFNTSSSKWLPKMRDCLEQVYGKMHRVATTIHSICDTRWNSAQACFASLLRWRCGLRVFAVLYGRIPSLQQVDLKLLLMIAFG